MTGHVTINAGYGNDTIVNTGPIALLNGGPDNDYISNTGDNVTIKGSTGDDTLALSNYTTRILYANGDGNDILTNYNNKNVILITDGSQYATVASGNDIIIYVGAGSMRLKDAVGKTLNISGGSRVNYLNFTNTANNIVVNGLSGNDSIANNASNVTINTGAGNDLIAITGANNVIEYAAGDGLDTVTGFNNTDTLSLTDDSDFKLFSTLGGDLIVSVGIGSILMNNLSLQNLNVTGGKCVMSNIMNTTSQTLLSGTSNADSIVNSGSDVTIAGGTGDDTIKVGTNNVIRYASGDGNDIITGFGVNSTLQITSGSITSHYADGNDYIINVGSGKLTFKNACSMPTVHSTPSITTSAITITTSR